jgi:hypothetical protein
LAGARGALAAAASIFADRELTAAMVADDSARASEAEAEAAECSRPAARRGRAGRVPVLDASGVDEVAGAVQDELRDLEPLLT